MKNIHRILYIRTDRMGDVLMNLPAIHLLRQTFPKAWITLMTDRSVAGLFQGHEDLDEVLPVEISQLEASMAQRQALTKKVREIGFDMAVVSNPSKHFHYLTLVCGIPIRVGWRRKWGFCLNRSIPDTKDSGKTHEIESNLSLIRLVSDRTWDGALSLPVDPASTAMIKRSLESRAGSAGIIALHAGSSHPGKRWPTEHFLELGQRIQKDGRFRVVFIGGAEEAEEGERLEERLGGGALSLCGKLSLSELTAFFKDDRVRCLVSSDSGPVHVCWISHKPVVAFYAKNVPGSDPVRWGPRDKHSCVIFKSMQEIGTEEVWASLQQVVGS